MSKLIIIRHGQSVWNLENRFTGWADVMLSANGIEEAKKAAESLRMHTFDKIYVSHMMRAIQTLLAILEKTNDTRTPFFYHDDDEQILSREYHTGDSSKELEIRESKAIAERFYGGLQGLNKKETAEKYGDEQVHIWRRSYDVPPPNGESLKDTLERVLPYFNKYIIPDLKSGKTILIVAHGNSLRAIMKFIEKISDSDIPNMEIPTGIPIEYELDNDLNVISKKELK